VPVFVEIAVLVVIVKFMLEPVVPKTLIIGDVPVVIVLILPEKVLVVPEDEPPWPEALSVCAKHKELTNPTANTAKNSFFISPPSLI